MTAGWRLVTPATLRVITADEAREHCRVSSLVEDAQFDAWITAATQWVERYTGRGLLTQSYRLALPSWVTSVSLPYAAPLQSITEVEYYDADNAQQTWTSSNYRTNLYQEPGRFEIDQDATRPSTYWRDDAVQIEYVVGWTSAELVPAPMVQAVKMLVADWYANRENSLVGITSRDAQFSVEALCAPYRVWWAPPC